MKCACCGNDYDSEHFAHLSDNFIRGWGYICQICEPHEGNHQLDIEDGLNMQNENDFDFKKLEPLHPTKEDKLVSEINDLKLRLYSIELELSKQQLKVEYQDKPDTVQVLSPSGFVTRKGVVIGSSVVITPNGPDIVFIIKGEDNRIAGISAAGVRFT